MAERFNANSLESNGTFSLDKGEENILENKIESTHNLENFEVTDTVDMEKERVYHLMESDDAIDTIDLSSETNRYDDLTNFEREYLELTPEREMDLAKEDFNLLPEDIQVKIEGLMHGRYMSARDRTALVQKMEKSLADAREKKEILERYTAAYYRGEKPEIEFTQREKMRLAAMGMIITTLFSYGISKSFDAPVPKKQAEISDESDMPKKKYEHRVISEAELSEQFETAVTSDEFRNVIRNYIEQERTLEIDDAKFHIKAEYLARKESKDRNESDEELDVMYKVALHNVEKERERYQKLSEVLEQDLVMLEILRNTPRYVPEKAQYMDIAAEGVGNCDARSKRLTGIIEHVYPNMEYKYIVSLDHILFAWKDSNGIWRHADTAIGGEETGDVNWISPLNSKDLEGFRFIDRDSFFKDYAQVNVIGQQVQHESANQIKEESFTKDFNTNAIMNPFPLNNPPTRNFGSSTSFVAESVEAYEARMQDVDEVPIERFAIDISDNKPALFIVRMKYAEDSKVPQVGKVYEVREKNGVGELYEVTAIEEENDKEPEEDSYQAIAETISFTEDGETIVLNVSDGRFVDLADLVKVAHDNPKKMSKIKNLKISGNIKNLLEIQSLSNLEYIDITDINNQADISWDDVESLEEKTDILVYYGQKN